MATHREANESRPGQVQFRPSPVLARILAEYASIWHVSENEVAKRLVALAACRLSLEHYLLLALLSEALTPPLGLRPDFATAREQAYVALLTADQIRAGLERFANAKHTHNDVQIRRGCGGRDLAQPFRQGHGHGLGGPRCNPAQVLLHLAEQLLDGRLVRTVRRQRLSPRPGLPQGHDGPGVPVRLQVVPDHHVPRPYFRCQHFLDIMLEGRGRRRRGGRRNPPGPPGPVDRRVRPRAGFSVRLMRWRRNTRAMVLIGQGTPNRSRSSRRVASGCSRTKARRRCSACAPRQGVGPPPRVWAGPCRFGNSAATNAPGTTG